MSNTQEAYDDDVDWLYRACEKLQKRPNEADEDRFVNAVTELIRNEKKNVNEARLLAFKTLYR